MRLIFIAFICTLMSGIPVDLQANKKSDVPEYTVEGLRLVPNTKDIALVWAEPGVSLSQYERVYLVEPYVAFKKNWQRDQNRGSIKISGSDMERIKANVKKLFMEVFTEELGKGGYTLATERAEDVLIVKPAIVNLDVNAPDVRNAGRTTTFARSAGSMTLYMELYDSETDDLIAKAMDARADRDNGYMQWQTGPANRAAGMRMMRPWAEALVHGLDEARNSTKDGDK